MKIKTPKFLPPDRVEINMMIEKTKMEKDLINKFNEFIESGALDVEGVEFQEYENCIVEFDNKN